MKKLYYKGVIMEQRFFNVVIFFLTLVMLFTITFMGGCDRHSSGSVSSSLESSHGGGSF